MINYLSRIILLLAGHFTFGGKSYWVSWASNEGKLRNARWNWFTGRNYCRKVIIPTQYYDYGYDFDLYIRIHDDDDC